MQEESQTIGNWVQGGRRAIFLHEDRLCGKTVRITANDSILIHVGVLPMMGRVAGAYDEVVCLRKTLGKWIYR
jgi:hypothetical protein